MRLNLALIISIIVAVGIVAFAFTFYHISTEKNKLNSELEIRLTNISDVIIQDFNISNKKINQKNIEKFIETTNAKYTLFGIAFYFSSDSLVYNSSVKPLIENSFIYISQALASDTTIGNYFTLNDKQFYQLIVPISKNNFPNNAIILYSDATYINDLIEEIWLSNFFRWFFQVFFVSIVTLLIIRFGVFEPTNKIVDWIKAAKVGDVDKLNKKTPASFLAPLHKEVVQIAKAMQDAKSSAEEEARLRTKSEAIWTSERLKIEIKNLLQNKKLIVVSNREPYMHMYEGKIIKCIVPASGMITAMEPILKSCEGLWIASGSGDADKETVDKNDKLIVPPENPNYTLRRLWLTKEEENHFYYGFSNEGLWPLCHIAHTRPVFRKEDWDYFQKVNLKFADAILEETNGEDDPFILIQDFHFALLPELIKKKKPKAKVAIFWHIPWPNPESFGICPWQREILLGMLGADLIGFHTQYHCNHFLETVNNSLESRVAWENFSIKMKGHTTFVKPFPISIDFTTKDFELEEKHQTPKQILFEHGIEAKFMGIGVDRIDYTKGIVEKFLAIERFFEKNSEYIGIFTFVQIGAPSRTLLKSYADILSLVENEANRINWRFKKKNWIPILLLKRHHSHKEIANYYNSANFCMVTSLHDGMNLVAKEFVATRNQNNGSLILSRFAGAAQELQGAIIVNPYDTEKSADAIKFALEMDLDEQNQRMAQMRKVIVSHNIFSWAANLIKTMSAIKN